MSAKNDRAFDLGQKEGSAFSIPRVHGIELAVNIVNFKLMNATLKAQSGFVCVP